MKQAIKYNPHNTTYTQFLEYLTRKIASKEGISKENFKQKLSELEKDIFSKKDDNKLMMVFFPGLTEIARFIENTVFQYSQKRTKQIFKQTEEETLLQIQGEDFGGAMNVFLYNLRENLLIADFSRKDITNLFKRIKAYMTKEFSEEEINQQAEAYFTKATEAQNLGEFKLAEKYYNLAIELNPYNSKFYSARAAIRKELNKDEEAYQDSVKAAEVSSDYYDLAVSEYELGKKEAAIEHLKLAIKNTTDESKIESYIKILQQWYGSLSSQKKKKDKEAQKAKEEEAAKEEQRLAQAYLNTFNAQNELAKAKQFISDSEYEKALKIYNDLIRFAPIDADYYFYRADLLQTYLGRTGEALQDLNTALNIDTTNSKYYIRRGLLLWYGFGDLENRAKALKDFSAAAKYNKTYTNIGKTAFNASIILLPPFHSFLHTLNQLN